MYSAAGGRGGGSAFPYRSAHQQGQKGGTGGKGKKAPKTKPKRRKKLFCAQLLVPEDHRGRIIGPRGAAVAELQQTTAASVWVPGRRSTDSEASVRVSAESMRSLLHACWAIAELALDEAVPCTLEHTAHGSDAVRYTGTIHPIAEGAFLTGVDGLSGCCVECKLEPQVAAVLIDNEKFKSEEHNLVLCDVVCLPAANNTANEEPRARCLIFMLGQRATSLCAALNNAIVAASDRPMIQ